MRVNCCICGEEFNLIHDEYIVIEPNKYACGMCKQLALQELIIEQLKKKMK